MRVFICNTVCVYSLNYFLFARKPEILGTLAPWTYHRLFWGFFGNMGQVDMIYFNCVQRHFALRWLITSCGNPK